MGRTIDRRRAEKNIPVARLADAAGVNLSQMVKVLGGKAGLSLYSMQRIASALDWTLGELAIAAFPPRRRGNTPVPSQP